MSYVDNRDWPEYNAQLVRRGEFYLDLNCVKNWSWVVKDYTVGIKYVSFICYPTRDSNGEKRAKAQVQ